MATIALGVDRHEHAAIDQILRWFQFDGQFECLRVGLLGSPITAPVSTPGSSEFHED